MLLFVCVMGVSGGGSRMTVNYIQEKPTLKSGTLTPRPQEPGLGAFLAAAAVGRAAAGGRSQLPLGSGLGRGCSHAGAEAAERPCSSRRGGRGGPGDLWECVRFFASCC